MRIEICICFMKPWVDLAYEYNATTSPTNTCICYKVPFHTFPDKIWPEKSQISGKKAKDTVKRQEIRQTFDKGSRQNAGPGLGPGPGPEPGPGPGPGSGSGCLFFPNFVHLLSSFSCTVIFE